MDKGKRILRVNESLQNHLWDMGQDIDVAKYGEFYTPGQYQTFTWSCGRRSGMVYSYEQRTEILENHGCKLIRVLSVHH